MLWLSGSANIHDQISYKRHLLTEIGSFLCKIPIGSFLCKIPEIGSFLSKIQMGETRSTAVKPAT